MNRAPAMVLRVPICPRCNAVPDSFRVERREQLGIFAGLRMLQVTARCHGFQVGREVTELLLQEPGAVESLALSLEAALGNAK